MTEEPEQAAPPSEQPEEQTAKTLEYREISPDELQETLEQHRKWVETRGKEGKRADLNNVNLQGADLREAHLEEADLREADLSEAHLEKAHLVGANLEKAHLYEAHLEEANFRQANLQKASLNLTILREAHLQDADLTGATGLLASQLAGANVSGAKLPKDIHEFKGVEQVKEISQRAQKLFLSILLGCVYCWLTIATTTDVGLITNSGSSPLPIIQTKIPIAGFYGAAPLILVSLYFWFHLYLQRLWERLSQLPAVFPDGEALDEKVYPWLISGMVRSYVRLLKEHRPALSRMQSGISILLAWWMVPFTFLLFWLRYVPRHDWAGTSLHVGVLTVSITAAILLHRLAAKTLRGERTSSLSWKEKVKSLPAYQHASLTLGILGLSGIIFFHLSTWAIEGVRPKNSVNSWEDLSKPPPEFPSLKWHDGRILLPRLFDYFGYRTYANLVEADMSTKPSGWSGTGEKKTEEIPLVKGVDLRGKNLNQAVMNDSFLVKANLEGAQLQGANLFMAKLEWANLVGAHLEKAILIGAHLEKANLEVAYLAEADLFRAYLVEANLYAAHLEKAHLVGANLEKANLRTAHLQEADLRLARLEKADMGLANLEGAHLQGANLFMAKLEWANLVGAHLTDVKNLTQAQLNEACVDENTILPGGLTRPEPCSKEELRFFY